MQFINYKFIFNYKKNIIMLHNMEKRGKKITHNPTTLLTLLLVWCFPDHCFITHIHTWLET